MAPVSDNNSGNESKLMRESDYDYSNSTNNKSCRNQTSTSTDTDEPRKGSTGLRMRYEVLSDLGEYWDPQNGTVSTRAAYIVLSMITDYRKLTASPNTPQYGFKNELKCI